MEYKLDIEKLIKNLPPEIKDLTRFVLWCYEPGKPKKSGEPGKPTKVPYCDVGRKASTTNPQTWNTFDGILELYRANPDYFSGVGIVLGDRLTGIDLDDVVDDDGYLDPNAAQIIDALPGYVELSPSGTGIHILVKGALPHPDERQGLKFGNIEFYDETSARYLTMTSDVWEERSEYNTEDASKTIAEVYWRTQKSFEEEKKLARRLEGQERKKAKVANNEASKLATRSNYEVDDIIIQRIRKSKQGAKFVKLFDHGDISEYKSKSEAVMALLTMLAYWTQKDESRTEQLFK